MIIVLFIKKNKMSTKRYLEDLDRRLRKSEIVAQMIILRLKRKEDLKKLYAKYRKDKLLLNQMYDRLTETYNNELNEVKDYKTIPYERKEYKRKIPLHLHRQIIQEKLSWETLKYIASKYNVTFEAIRLITKRYWITWPLSKIKQKWRII